jgi:hypothetical protein
MVMIISFTMIQDQLLGLKQTQLTPILMPKLLTQELDGIGL